MSKEVTKHVIEIPDDIPLNPQFLVVYGTEPIGNKIRTYTIEMDKTEELNSDYINEHFGDLQDDAYQRGIEDGKEVNGKGCKGCRYEHQVVTMPPCNTCCNGYSNQWQAKQTDDEIKVGDEVERSVYGRTEGKGIYLEDADEEGDWLKCLFWTGATFTVLAYPKEQFKKTGRHFDISSILKEMQS